MQPDRKVLRDSRSSRHMVLVVVVLVAVVLVVENVRIFVAQKIQPASCR
jgi:hypothetical protein